MPLNTEWQKGSYTQFYNKQMIRNSDKMSKYTVLSTMLPSLSSTCNWTRLKRTKKQKPLGSGSEQEDQESWDMKQCEVYQLQEHQVWWWDHEYFSFQGPAYPGPQATAGTWKRRWPEPTAPLGCSCWCWATSPGIYWWGTATKDAGPGPWGPLFKRPTPSQHGQSCLRSHLCKDREDTTSSETPPQGKDGFPEWTMLEQEDG